jgi:DNA helicase HerA-like ATPase
MTRLIGGAVIQQVFTLLQTGRIRKKILLIVDETSLVQNPALASILSEARKFGLTVMFAQQYLGQLEEGVLKSVQANMVNLFCFKVAREDADTVNKMMNLEINPVFEKERAFAKVEDMKTDMLTKSNPRECVFRVMQNGRLVRPVKARTVDVESLVI